MKQFQQIGSKSAASFGLASSFMQACGGFSPKQPKRLAFAQCCLEL
jgi:hypothetical protein